MVIPKILHKFIGYKRWSYSRVKINKNNLRIDGKITILVHGIILMISLLD